MTARLRAYKASASNSTAAIPTMRTTNATGSCSSQVRMTFSVRPAGLIVLSRRLFALASIVFLEPLQQIAMRAACRCFHVLIDGAQALTQALQGLAGQRWSGTRLTHLG